MIVTSNGATRSAAWITVEYMLADGTLDVFIADLLETKLRLIGAVESEESCALWLRKGVHA
jgi:hypothetical protein